LAQAWLKLPASAERDIQRSWRAHWSRTGGVSASSRRCNLLGRPGHISSLARMPWPKSRRTMASGIGHWSGLTHACPRWRRLWGCGGDARSNRQMPPLFWSIAHGLRRWRRVAHSLRLYPCLGRPEHRRFFYEGAGHCHGNVAGDAEGSQPPSSLRRCASGGRKIAMWSSWSTSCRH